MKKFSLLLALVVIFILPACANYSTSYNTEYNTTTTTTEAYDPNFNRAKSEADYYCNNLIKQHSYITYISYDNISYSEGDLYYFDYSVTFSNYSIRSGTVTVRMGESDTVPTVLGLEFND